MSWTPDERIGHADGTVEHIRYSKAPRHDQLRQRMRKIFGPDGQLREIWHEVVDGNGAVIHRHQKF